MREFNAAGARLAFVAATLIGLILVAPKDCVIIERSEGPDSTRCSSLVGLEWANRTTAFAVMAAVALLAAVAAVVLRRRGR